MSNFQTHDDVTKILQDRYREDGDKSVGIDFDNTITSALMGACYDWMNFPEPKEKVIETIRELHRMGRHIIIHTARLNKRWNDDMKIVKAMIEAYLNHYQITFDDVIGKPYCRYYVGDGYFDDLGEVVERIAEEGTKESMDLQVSIPTHNKNGEKNEPKDYGRNVKIKGISKTDLVCVMGHGTMTEWEANRKFPEGYDSVPMAKNRLGKVKISYYEKGEEK